MKSELKPPRKNFKSGDVVKVRFETMALGGRAKGVPLDADPIVSVFVQGAAPGDLALCRVTQVVKRYIEADLVEVIEPSKCRVQPACPHFGECGGCQWQMLGYQAQLSAKEELVRYILARKGIDRSLIKPIIPSPKEFGYRSRVDLEGFLSPERCELGFFKSRSHERLDIRTCPILMEPMDGSLEEIKTAILNVRDIAASNIPFKVRLIYDQLNRRILVMPFRGTLRGRGESTVFVLDDAKLHVMPENGPMPGYQVGHFQIHFDPTGFIQVNPFVNEHLVKKAVEALKPEKTDEVLELFSGAGNFTMALAQSAQKIFAIENSPDIEMAKQNADIAGLDNIEFIQSAALDAVQFLNAKQSKADLVLLDPPREGGGQELMRAISRLGPRRIAYVSCHPRSLALDLESLIMMGYRVESVQPFDMFPQTYHAETLTILDFHG